MKNEIQAGKKTNKIWKKKKYQRNKEEMKRKKNTKQEKIVV